MQDTKRNRLGNIKRRGYDVFIFNRIGYAVVFIFGMLCVLPFVLVVVNSFTSESSLMRNGYGFWISEFSLEAYKLAFKNPNRIFWAYRNTIFATVIGTTLNVLLCTMTGYVLQRKDFPWRNIFSFFFFFTTLFNGGLVPWYMMCVRNLGFKNSYHALVLPLMFSVWNMIIAKNFMKSIPFEITESAKVDGANDLIIFVRLILPLAKPLLATLGLFSALNYWNDWYNCMLFNNNERMMSLQYFLHEIISSLEALRTMIAAGATAREMENLQMPQETMKMAMTVITTGPILLLYPFVQKYFVKGLTIGAVKG